MAISGSFNSSEVTSIRHECPDRGRFYWERTGYSIENNESYIKWNLTATGGSASNFYCEYYKRYVNIDGERAGEAYQGTITTAFNGTVLLEGTKTIKHNDDGTKSFSVDMALSIAIDSSQYNTWGSATFTLDPIPRASQPTCPESYILDSNTDVIINMNRSSNTFTHDVYLYVGDNLVEIHSGVPDSLTRRLESKDYAKYITEDYRGTLTIKVDTYNASGTLIGTKSTTMTLIVPDTVRPTALLTVEEAEELLANINFGEYVQGRSKLRIGVNGIQAYSSPLTTYQAVVENILYLGQINESHVLNNSGNISITARVTDKRGHTSYDTVETINVLPYEKPKITSSIINRCDINGNLNDEGEYLIYSFIGSISNLNNKNTKMFSIEYKKRSDPDSAYTSIAIESASYTVNKEHQILKDSSGNPIKFDPLISYDIQFNAFDRFEETKIPKLIETGFDIFNIHRSGRSLAIGKISEATDDESLLEIALDTKYKGNMLLTYNILPEEEVPTNE